MSGKDLYVTRLERFDADISTTSLQPVVEVTPQAMVMEPSYWVVNVVEPAPTTKSRDAEERWPGSVVTVTSESVFAASGASMQLPPSVGEKSPALSMVAVASQRRARSE